MAAKRVRKKQNKMALATILGVVVLVLEILNNILDLFK
ncbi:hypothetical protein SAMN05444955_102292 [Lihuaxuella thermophila]|uniref:Uncharacterized protein n=1 Tax=Lihuaxuella thermophila TaxID=1173111 RepID=A0A1H8BRL8_9BACL|nr:hypothetical protein SAMN05444955_102292 [Lihuaxuella thermophila]